jgi:hypothetical protein
MRTSKLVVLGASGRDRRPFEVLALLNTDVSPWLDHGGERVGCLEHGGPVPGEQAPTDEFSSDVVECLWAVIGGKGRRTLSMSGRSISSSSTLG